MPRSDSALNVTTRSRCASFGALAHLALGLLVCGTLLAGERIPIDDFEQGLRPAWRSRSFAGETDYRVEETAEGHVLRAESRGSASALIYELKVDLAEHPILTWRWKVEATVPGGAADSKQTDDYAARVFVVFPSWFPGRTRSINYIWANRLSVGAAVPSPYSVNAMMIAVESGPERAGRWVSVRRNVYEDYERAFGKPPPRAGGVALMTDSDNTGASALAWYDDIAFESQ